MIFLSVGEVLDMAVRGGSIDSRFTGAKRAVEGTKIHKRLQKKHTLKTAEAKLIYESEVTIKHTFNFRERDFTLMGRIDGLIETEKKLILEEIKSTAYPLGEIEEPVNASHIAQAKMYAYMYLEKTGLKQSDIYLTYASLEGDEKSLAYDCSYEELKDFFYDIMAKYYMWTELDEQLKKRRNLTLESLRFPFESYRKGQRELAVAVYKTLVSEKKLFVSVPTGTGKTAGTLFPALKFMVKPGEREKRIFYLTSKNTIKALAEDALKLMETKGLYIVSSTLTAKEKICLNNELSCNPLKCTYAKGHFDRVNGCIENILKNETIITADIFKSYSEKYHVCPFELSLDAAMFSHVIICDYNYAFDPRAKLSRFFDDDRNEDYIALIDEAHNLPDRSREMYSADFSKSEILEARRSIKGGSPIIGALYRLNSYMLKEKYISEELSVSKERDENFIYALSAFTTAADKWLVKNEGSPAYEKIQNLYFKAMDYIKTDEFFDRHFALITENKGKELKKTIFCRDSSEILKQLSKNFSAMIFFSATLSPMEYFMEILGGSPEKDNRAELSSPFDRNNLCVIKDLSVSTLYKNREMSYEPIAERIYAMKTAKEGNYICFFPSYEYMETVYNCYTQRYGDKDTLIQKRDLSEENRTAFLKSFSENSFLLGFCVLGGVFSEGIDLKGNRLIGCCIVGVGLPKLSVKQNIIREFFDNEGKNGFAYSYAYPGMIKVSQAGGRVIRSDTDRGVILLIDSRFSSGFYSSLLPRHWYGAANAFGTENIKKLLSDFWKR